MTQNIRSNGVIAKQSTTLKVLSESQCSEIFEAALRVLNDTGCEVQNEEAREILKKAGAKVKGDKAFIPPYLIEKALRTAPKQVTIYDTEGNPAMHMSAANRKNHWGTGYYNTYVIDRKTKERRLAVYNDAYECGLVVDSLANFDLVSGSAYISDRCVPLAEVYETRVLLEVSSKPQIVAQPTPQALEAQIELMAAVTGSVDRLFERPCGIFVNTPNTPLSHSNEALEKAMLTWKYGLPASYSVAAMIGASSPSTLAGAMVVGLADTFVGLVLSQEINPGTPFFPNMATAPFSMMSMDLQSGNPEMFLGAAANADLFRYFGLPSMLLVGGTDAHIFDQHAAGQIALGIMAGTLSGCSLSTQGGCMENSGLGSLDAIVYANEIIDMCRLFSTGVEVSPETLAESTIDNVGPGGNFLGELHTVQHFRKAWNSDLFAPINNDGWEAAGKKDLGVRCNEKVEAIIAAGPRNPRDPELIEKLDTIMEKYEAKLK